MTCSVERTRKWDDIDGSCACPSGMEACDVEEAEVSTAWKADVTDTTANVFLRDSIKFSLESNLKIFYKVKDPCRASTSYALCKGRFRGLLIQTAPQKLKPCDSGATLERVFLCPGCLFLSSVLKEGMGKSIKLESAATTTTTTTAIRLLGMR